MRADRSNVVQAAKDELEARGVDLSGPCGAFAIVELAAWRLRDEGAGLLDKPGGNNCQGFATDIIAYPDGEIYDVLVGAGDTNGASWQGPDMVDPSRYRAAHLPSGVIDEPDPRTGQGSDPYMEKLDAIYDNIQQLVVGLKGYFGGGR